jgi:putative membrane protein
MRNFKAALFILITAAVLQACNHSAKSDDNDDDSNNSAPDTSTAVATAPPDTIGPKIHLVIDQEDSIFAVNAAKENLAEIELGQLAIKNAKGKRFKNFGWLMVKDHGKANTKLMAMAQLKKLPLPTKIDSTEQNKITQLAKKSGGDFNKAYVAMMIDDGKNDVKVFTDASTKTQDPDIKAYAKKTLPVIQKHLDAINAIHDSMSQ